VRRGALWLSVALAVAFPAAPHPSAGARWHLGPHVIGVFDVVGPRSDGRLVVAARGGLDLLDGAGTVTRFAPAYAPPVGGEAYVAISPGLADPRLHCEFARDTVAAIDVAPRKPGITLVSPLGKVSHLAFVGVAGLFGITFDTTGRFGHRILVVGRTPDRRTQVSAIDCLGRVHPVGTVPVLLEGGITVAPPTFGAFAGQLIAPDELDGSIYAVSPSAQLRTVAASGLASGQDIGVESLGFVSPAGPGDAYLADRSTPRGLHPGDDRILELSGATLRSAGVRSGDLLAATEGGATVVRVRCTAVCSVAKVVAVPTAAHGEGSLTVVPSR
jgi:hypothetical protein